MTTTPFLRRIINCAKSLMALQGFPRRRAIRAAIQIVKRNESAAPRIRRLSDIRDNADALEYLDHRNHSMHGSRR